MAKPTTASTSTNKDVVESVLSTLGVADFDVAMFGDGSGNFVNTPCGWCCTLYDRASGRVWEHFGGANGGTNNYAELIPYAHALWAYHTEMYGNQGAVPVRPVRVLVVSDSEVTVRCGSGQYARRANGSLWAFMEWFERNGYVFRWHHVSRNTNLLNARADKVAGLVRKSLEGFPASPSDDA